MADYYGQCVVTPFIPVTDMNPAERLLLNSIFSHETSDDEVYFFADPWREMNFVLQLEEVHAALSASPADCVASCFLTDCVTQNDDQHDFLEVDMDDHWMGVCRILSGARQAYPTSRSRPHTRARGCCSMALAVRPSSSPHKRSIPCRRASSSMMPSAELQASRGICPNKSYCRDISTLIAMAALPWYGGGAVQE